MSQDARFAAQTCPGCGRPVEECRAEDVDESFPLMPHTEALTYSRFERLHFKLFGYWPQSVVDRRLAALRRDEEGRSRV